MPDQPQSHSPRDGRKLPKMAAAGGIFLILALLLAALFPFGTPLELEYKVGGVWAQKDLIAPFSFPILRNQGEYNAEVEKALSGVYPVFRRIPNLGEIQLSNLRTLFETIRSVIRLRLHGVAPGDSVALANLLTSLELPFSEPEWEGLTRLYQEERLSPMEERIAWIGNKCWSIGILDRQRASVGRQEIAVRDGNEETILRSAVLYEPDEVEKVLDAELLKAYNNESAAAGLATRIGLHYIRANVHFDQTATDESVRGAESSVPRTIGYVQENERIVSKHERISDETILKLESFRRAKADRRGDEDLPAQFAGVLLHVLLILLLLAIYLGLFRPRISGDSRKLILLAILILSEGILAFLTRELETDLPFEYLIVVPVASMLLAILFDSRVAFYGTVTTSLLVAAIRGNDYSIALASLVAGALSVYTVRDIRNRTQIFRSMGYIFLGYGATIAALSLERFSGFSLTLTQLGFAALNALVSPILTYGLLMFFERTFRITTDLTLIEVSHVNHPLLRQLAARTPGTYHHSMTIANLAESAAIAIGANEVLARAGAFFHDIGKTLKPTYFVENQRTLRSRHDRLSPKASAEIIRSHVTTGIELAKEHNLPREIIDFIPMHHGTTRIEYFYGKALEMAAAEDGNEGVDESDYKYPGPKPQTKETGILMLADSTEARVRSLEDHSSASLRETIDGVVRKRFEEGELDECPLTVSDLTRIKEAFLRVLIGAYHARVKYPDQQEKRKGRRKRVRSRT